MSLRNIITSPLAITTIALLSLLLNACGVGESDLTLPSKRPEGSIHGNVLGGLYSGGKISAYTFAEKETRQFIANADVQADGTFELDIQLPSQPLLIEVSGGNYFDPGSFQTVTPEPQFVLSTVLLYRSGETHETSITPLTHFNAGLLLYLQNTLASPISETLIKQTSQKIGNLYSVNQIGSPITLSYQDQPRKISITGDERQGLFINALAQIAYEERRLKEASLKDNYQLSSLTASLYEDIHSDGVFDGNAIFDNSQEIKPLAFGNTLINADFYRLLTAFALKKTLRYTPSLAVSDSEEGIETLLLDIAQRESDLIPSTDNDALHKSKPVISPITDFTKAKNGDTKFDFSVDNALILTSATMTINGLEYELELSDISKNFGNLLSISLDTTQFTDGVQQLDLTIKDSFDNIGNFQTDVTFDNSPPTLTLQSANLTNESEFLLQGTYDDAFSAIDSILVNGEKIPFDEKTGWEKAVTLSSGRNEFLIQISDVLGNKAQTTALVLRDTAAPVITLSDSPALTNNSQYLLQGTFIEGESDIRKITVNDKEATLEANQKWSKQVALNKGENLFTIGIEDSAGNYSEYATSIFLDDQAPLISVTSAALTNSPTFTLHGQYEELSPGENKINVNDIPVETMEDQEWSQPVQLVAGKNKFLITMKDEAGNLTAFYTEVVLDLLAPTIVLNSPGVSNSPLF
ncbi:MAG TPA: hypothetical protein ENK06_02290, partial [Gammaproteobacteria bacterium]|nr:hypothetical protein [Gammaproteobacteria bacterium]